MTAPSRYDLQVLNNYLRVQAQPALLRYGGLALLAILIWLWLCWQGLTFGLAQRYEFLAKFSPGAQDMALRANPYIWWTLAFLLTWGVLSMLRHWARGKIEQHWSQTVPPGELATICRGLSQDGRTVLAWVWQPRDVPLTLGDLRRTAEELANSRVEKSHLAEEQQTVLEQALAPPPALDLPPLAADVSQPVAKRQRTEPRIIGD